MTINRDYYGNPKVPGPPGGGVNLPPVDKLGVSMEGVNTALEEARGYEDQLKEAVAELGRAEKRLEETKNSDISNYAAAIRAGEKTPDSKAVEKTEKEVREAERKAEALVAARDDCVAEARRLIDSSRSRWRSESEGAEDRAGERYEAAVEELRAARADYTETRSLVRWLQDPGHRLRPGAPDRPIEGPGGAGGAPSIDMGRVFETLRTEAQGHVRDREKANAPLVEMKQGQPQRTIDPKEAS